MSFLFPLYLIGALAIALPILLHLRKRPPKEKIPFGSLMFLEKSPEKLTRRTKIERWLLLALRCLALLALALVFGRPFLKSTVLPSELPDKSISVILIDRSASMQREDLAKQAVEAAQKAVRNRKADDDVAVLAFDRETKAVADFTEWNALDPRARASDLQKRIEQDPNGWDIADPGKALIEAADRIAAKSGDTDYRTREIVLISDFQEGADFDSLNQFAWPENLSVECVQVSPKKPGNLSITLAASSEESRSAAELVHRVRIENAPESTSDRFELSWKGDPDSTISGVVPPGAGRVIKVPASKAAGNSGELVVSGDSHPYDNTVYIAPPSPLPLDIQFFTTTESPDEVGSPFFYLKRALHPTASLRPSVEISTFDQLKSSQAAALIIHGEWTSDMATTAREMAADGKLIVALPSSRTGADAIAALLGTKDSELTLSESEDEKYAMLSGLDFEHPVLAPFARAKIRDFTKVRFWKHRQLTFSENLPENLAILADFDTGSPAWLSQSAGKGNIFMFLSGWEPKESQFALSSKFVPVLYSIFENAGYSAKAAPAYYVGDVDIEKPDGEVAAATKPGLFKSTEGSVIGVNLHPSQGRVNPLDPDHLLSDFNIPLKSAQAAKDAEKTTDPGEKKRLENEEKESNQKLWKWFIIAVILFLIAETWLAGRRRQTPTPATV